MDAPWEELQARAATALAKAYAPYSNFRVGAAAVTSDGRFISGCNVENAAYGVTLCAECAMIGELFATGGGTLEYFMCYGQLADGALEVITPCGRCRQLLFEHRGADLRIQTASKIITIDELLPEAFGPSNLSA